MHDGDTFRLASVTDQTGFYSGQLGLTADGHYLLAYGSRKELLALLTGARGLFERQPRPLATSLLISLCALPVLAMVWVVVQVECLLKQNQFLKHLKKNY